MQYPGILVQTNDEAQRVINRLWDHEGDLGVDVETSGLNPRRCHIVAYVLTFGPTPQDNYYIPVRHAGGGNVPGLNDADYREAMNRPTKLHWFEEEFKKAVADKSFSVIGHNLMFDLLFMAKYGIKFLNSQFSCTQVRQALTNEFSPGFSLDASAIDNNVTAKKGEQLYAYIISLLEDGTHGKHEFKNPRASMAFYWITAGNHPVVVDYALGDGITTWELFFAQNYQVEKQDLHKIWALEKRTTKTLFAMQSRGIRIDVPYMTGMREELRASNDKLREPFLAFVNKDGVFAERSADCVRQAYIAAGYTDADFRKTPTGKFSFVEDWMETNELGQQIITIRKRANLDNSFISPALETHLFGDHIFPNYNQLRGDEFGTISGRLSSNDPNIQQVPKHEEDLSRLVRTGFLPDDGYYWSSNDFSQCEPRIFAEYTNSKFLIDGYLSSPPVDLYTNFSKITGASRRTCKRLALALFYGAGNAKAAYLIGCSEAEAAAYRNQVYANIPEIKEFTASAQNAMRQRSKQWGYGWVKSVGGRRLKIREYNYMYRASNRIVQASNADVIKHAINECHDYLESTGAGNLLLTCHDSIDWQILEGRDDVNRECIRIMEASCASETIPLEIPQKVDCGVGPNWAVATFGA